MQAVTNTGNDNFIFAAVYSVNCLVEKKKSLPFAGLAVGLGIGAIAEVVKKSLKPKERGDSWRVLLYESAEVDPHVWALLIMPGKL